VTFALAEGLELPEDAATQVYAFLGRRGSGKTYGAGVLTELLLAAGAQVIVLDPVGNWWGLRAPGRGAGLEIPILGGERGDVALTPVAGEVVARALVASRSSAVLDVSSFSKSDRRRFIVAFAEQFFQSKKHNRTPCHVVIEEAHLVLPQATRDKGDLRMLGAVEDLVRLGRNYGIGVSMLDQRPQSVSKDALNQAEVMLAFQLVGAHERDAIKRWVDYHGVGADLARLPKLRPGQAMAWASWLDKPGIVQVHQKQTFDASSTPKGIRTTGVAPMRRLALTALADAIREAGLEVGSDDPKALRAEIAQLRTGLAATMEDLKAARRDAEFYKERAMSMTALAQLAEVQKLLTDARNRLDIALSMRPPREAPAPPVARGDDGSLWGTVFDDAMTAAGLPPAPPPAPRRGVGVVMQPAASTSTWPTGLTPVQRVLLAMRTFNPPHADQLAVLAGYSAGASTLGVLLGKMQKEGLLDGQRQQTSAGVRLIADLPPVPPIGHVINWWVGELGGATGEVLQGLYHQGPATHDELCARHNKSPNASTMGVYLSKLRKKGLVVKVGGKFALAPAFALPRQR
jgi:hypothetical protein